MRTLPEVLTMRGSELLSRSLKIGLLLLLAFLATRLLRRGIRRFVGGLRGETVQRGLFRLRERAPGVLLPTSSAPTIRSAQRAETIGALLRSITTLVIWTIALLTIFGELGFDLGPLIAGAGIIGVAIGFGAQNLVRDFLSGIFMLIEDQYGVGDVVDLGPASGVVEGVSLRTTRLRDVEGNVWHVPNGTIDRVANKSQQWARAIVDVDVAGDVDEATGVVRRVADGMWDDAQWRADLLEPPELWGVEALGPDGFTVRLAVKVRPGQQWRVARELRGRLKGALDESGVGMAVARRLVYQGDGGAAGRDRGD